MRCGLCAKEIVFPDDWQLIGDVKVCEDCINSSNEQYEAFMKLNQYKTLSDFKDNQIKVEIGNTRIYPKDSINPSHYKQGELEVIDILEDKLPKEKFEGFLIGNVLKYAFRYEHKNGVEDLKKAKWYIEKLIKLKEGESD